MTELLTQSDQNLDFVHTNVKCFTPYLQGLVNTVMAQASPSSSSINNNMYYLLSSYFQDHGQKIFHFQECSASTKSL